MRIFKSITVGMSLLLLNRIAEARITCEVEGTRQIGWCMDPNNEQDREDCPVEFFDWDTPVEGDCPDDDNVSNPPRLTPDNF